MKITIELTEAQVKGIKKWNTETGGDPWKKADIANFIHWCVLGVLEHPNESVSDYIKQFESK